jgi:hypothetical protein
MESAELFVRPDRVAILDVVAAFEGTEIQAPEAAQASMAPQRVSPTCVLTSLRSLWSPSGPHWSSTGCLWVAGSPRNWVATFPGHVDDTFGVAPSSL